MTRHPLTLSVRFLALILSLALSLPGPSFALRQTGLEEQNDRQGNAIGHKADLIVSLTGSSVPAAVSISPLARTGLEERIVAQIKLPDTAKFSSIKVAVQRSSAGQLYEIALTRTGHNPYFVESSTPGFSGSGGIEMSQRLRSEEAYVIQTGVTAPAEAKKVLDAIQTEGRKQLPRWNYFSDGQYEGFAAWVREQYGITKATINPANQRTAGLEEDELSESLAPQEAAEKIWSGGPYDQLVLRFGNILTWPSNFRAKENFVDFFTQATGGRRVLLNVVPPTNRMDASWEVKVLSGVGDEVVTAKTVLQVGDVLLEISKLSSVPSSALGWRPG